MYKIIKRMLDISIASLSLIVFSPLFLIVALLIMWDSPGPIFFLQKRVGLNGKFFFIYKFRTMYTHLTGSFSTEKNDSRITRIGSLLRKTSVDELPQLFNVLKGDMSLVGPRPDVPDQQSLYTKSQWTKRISVQPGLTGLSQATLRSVASQKQRTSLDMEYIDKQSLLFDLKILWLTLKILFSDKGN